VGRALLPFIGCGALVSACSVPAHIPEKVTTDGLLAIRRGMTYAEVETLIGPPLCVVDVDDARLSEADETIVDGLVRDCGPLQRTTTPVPMKLREAAGLSLSYAEPRDSFTSPHIYLNFNAGRVVDVYIKKDGFGICCMEGLPTGPFYWVGSRALLHKLVGR
jgi:hypothetical protein